LPLSAGERRQRGLEARQADLFAPLWEYYHLSLVTAENTAHDSVLLAPSSFPPGDFAVQLVCARAKNRAAVLAVL